MLKMMRLLLGITISAIISVALGCNPSQRELSGSYTLEKGDWSGELELLPDGRLRETVVSAQGARIEITGTWRLEGSSLFRTPCVHFEPDGSGKQSEACSQSVQRTIGGPMIVIDPDFGLAYDR